MVESKVIKLPVTGVGLMSSEYVTPLVIVELAVIACSSATGLKKNLLCSAFYI